MRAEDEKRIREILSNMIQKNEDGTISINSVDPYNVKPYTPRKKWYEHFNHKAYDKRIALMKATETFYLLCSYIEIHVREFGGNRDRDLAPIISSTAEFGKMFSSISK